MNALNTHFQSVTEWVFDLDNTLYPRHCDLFSQIDWKMTDFVADLLNMEKTRARKLQKDLYRSHGTTLRGLMVEYEIDPHDFLEKVHDIDYSPIDPNPALGELIGALPGRKHIFTNGDVPHARRTTDQLGITEHFDEVFDIVASDLVPKPAASPYEKFINSHRVDPQKAAFFEDMPRNLEVPKKMGMRTVLITPQQGSGFTAEAWEHAVDDGASIDFTTDDLEQFLADVLCELNT